MFLEGQTLKIAEYPRLFEVFGFEYGGSEEDGEFQLPDPRDYFLRIFNPDGEREVGDTQEGGLPNITGQFQNGPTTYTNLNLKGAFSNLNSVWGSNYLWTHDSSGGYQYNGWVLYGFNANKSSSLYQDDINEVRPNNMTVRLIIKATYEDGSIAGIIDKVYPVGSLFLSLEDSEICPIEMVGVGKWELVESDRALQTSSDTHTPGELIEAGLPNISGGFGTALHMDSDWYYGAFGLDYKAKLLAAGSNANAGRLTFAASRSSSIYGKSSTVQPPALVVKVWKRVS